MKFTYELLRGGVHRVHIVRRHRAHRAHRAPVYGSNRAPAALQGPQPQYLLDSAYSQTKVGLRFRASPFGPCPYLVFRKEGGAVGAFTTHYDDSIWCAAQDVLAEIRASVEYRFDASRVRESPFSVKSTREEFTENLRPLTSSPELWAARQRPLPPGAIYLCQCKLAELCYLAAVSRPNIRARLTRIATQVTPLRGADVSRISVLLKTVQVRRQGQF